MRRHAMAVNHRTAAVQRRHRGGGGVTSLMYAAQQGDVDKVRRIIREQPLSLLDLDRTGKSPLHYCSTSGSLRAAQAADYMVMAAPELVDGRDEDGFTPLHLAVIAGNMQLVTFLLANGADVNAVDNEKHTVVHWATVCGETVALRAVLAAGAPVSTPDVHGGYPLHYAAQMCGGDRDSDLGTQVLQTLLTHSDIQVSVTDGDKRQPLLWAASAGSARAVLALVRAGAAVEAADKDGLTALHCAASRGHTDCMDTLLTLCGASPDVIDSNGCTALHYAVTLGHADATALLLAHGADPNRQDRKGRTPAHCGCAKGQFETVKLIGTHGANLWLRNARGDLPLHDAAASGRRELVKFLLDMRPSQVNARNNDGRCPLHMAALNDNADMCKILLDSGAHVNPILRTSKNIFMTPLDCALQRGFRSTAKFLQLHGGVPATRLSDIRHQPVNLLIRDDITFWGDTSSESERENGEREKSGKRLYRKKLSQKYERKRASVSSSEKESRVKSSKLENKIKKSAKKHEEKSADQRVSSKLDSGASSRKSGANKIPSSTRVDYSNEIVINGRTEINIHETRDIIIDKDNKQTELIETVITKDIVSSASGEKERRPRSAKYSKLRDRSSKSSAEQEIARATKGTVMSPENLIEKHHLGKELTLRDKSTNTSEETIETVIENKKSLLTKDDTVPEEDVLSKDSLEEEIMKKKPFQDTHSVMSYTSEDVEEQKKDIVVEASVHAPPSSVKKSDLEEQSEEQKNVFTTEDQFQAAETKTKEGDQMVVTEKDDSQGTVDNHDTKIKDLKSEIVDEKSSETNIEAEIATVQTTDNHLVEKPVLVDDAQKVMTNDQEIKDEIDNQENSAVLNKTELDNLNKNDREKIAEEIQTAISSQESPNDHTGTLGKVTNEIGVVESTENNVTEELSGEVPVREEKVSEPTDIVEEIEEKTEVGKAKNDELSTTEEVDEQLIKPEQGDFGDDAENIKSGVTEAIIEPQEVVLKEKSNEKTEKSSQKKKTGQNNKKENKIATKDKDKIKNKNASKKINGKTSNQINAEPKISAQQKLKRSKDAEDMESSDSDESLLISPPEKVHKSFTVLNEDEAKDLDKHAPKRAKKRDTLKKQRSHSDETKPVKTEKMREKTRIKSKIPTPMFKTTLSKSDRHLDKVHQVDQLDARIPSLPNIHDERHRLREPLRCESNMSAPPLTSLYSDNERDSVSDPEEGRRSINKAKRLVKRRPRTRESKSAGSDYESSNLIDSGFEPSPRSTRIPRWKNMSERGVNMTSVTQSIQNNIRRYHLERKIFQHLLELKRHQIRANQHNEAVLVKRAIDEYHRSCASTVGAGRYIPEDFTFKSFEKFLYEALRKLQKNGVGYMKGLPEPPSNPLLCTRSTHRCMHATHAYTGVPCAAYLPKMDHHTIPKIGYNSVACKPGTGGFLPSINAKKAVTLELSHGSDKQIISLPTDRLDQNKRYYVTFTVKGQEMTEEDSNQNNSGDNSAHRHAKSD